MGSEACRVKGGKGGGGEMKDRERVTDRTFSHAKP